MPRCFCPKCYDNILCLGLAVCIMYNVHAGTLWCVHYDHFHTCPNIRQAFLASEPYVILFPMYCVLCIVHPQGLCLCIDNCQASLLGITQIQLVCICTRHSTACKSLDQGLGMCIYHYDAYTIGNNYQASTLCKIMLCLVQACPKVWFLTLIDTYQFFVKCACVLFPMYYSQ